MKVTLGRAKCESASRACFSGSTLGLSCLDFELGGQLRAGVVI